MKKGKKFVRGKHQTNSFQVFNLGILLVASFSIGGYLSNHQDQVFKNSQKFTSSATKSSSACLIKGNVSWNTGERIYHVPGQRDYYKTKISPIRGELWFCSEAQARNSGWRKARTR